MKAVFVFAGMVLCLWCNGQRISQGSEYPDEVLHDVINYTTDSLKLSQFKKKLVILDMWDIRCASCIAAFPELDALQKKFDRHIQIVMVNRQSKDSTLRFFAKRKKIKLPELPFVTGDKKLNEYFPYSGYPYHVWIDSNQKLRFVTESYNATPEHISKFLKGEKLLLDSLVSKDYTGPLLRSGNHEWINQIEFYSLISKCIKGLNVGYANGMNKGNSLRLSSNCSSIVELFQKAFEEGGLYNFKLPSKIVVDASPVYAYMRPNDPNELDDWEKEHSYNYEIVLPGESKDNMYDHMKQDLERYFGIQGRIEKRNIKSMVLVRTSKEDKLKTKGGKSEDQLRLSSSYFPIETSIRYLTNSVYSLLSMKLKAWVEHASLLPFKDETGYVGNIDIAINGDVYDSFNLLLLKKELNKYDLDIITKEVAMEVLILRRNKTH